MVEKIFKMLIETLTLIENFFMFTFLTIAFLFALFLDIREQGVLLKKRLLSFAIYYLLFHLIILIFFFLFIY